VGKRRDLAGKKFNRLLAIEINEEVSKQKGYVFWDFKCDCGVVKAIKGTMVTMERTKSCGCLNKELASKRATKKPGVGALNALMSEYKHNAKRRNIDWNLERKYFKEIVEKNCFYCGEKPKPWKTIKNTTHTIANGIDRVDSDLGYCVENCVACCSKCNAMKNKWSNKDFLDHVKRIYKKWDL